jgi:hypothetical protein
MKKRYILDDFFGNPHQPPSPGYDYEAPQSDPWDASNEPDGASPLEMIQPDAIEKWGDQSAIDEPELDAWLAQKANGPSLDPDADGDAAGDNDFDADGYVDMDALLHSAVQPGSQKQLTEKFKGPSIGDVPAVVGGIGPYDEQPPMLPQAGRSPDQTKMSQAEDDDIAINEEEYGRMMRENGGRPLSRDQRVELQRRLTRRGL